MKVIDLLVKIANKEELPKIVKYYNYLLTYDEDTQDYYNEPSCTYSLLNDIHYKLNDEVKIIEDNKIEHIGKIYDITNFKNDYPEVAKLLNDIANKQYEIIDKINGDEKDEN